MYGRESQNLDYVDNICQNTRLLKNHRFLNTYQQKTFTKIYHDFLVIKMLHRTLNLQKYYLDVLSIIEKLT